MGCRGGNGLQKVLSCVLGKTCTIFSRSKPASIQMDWRLDGLSSFVVAGRVCFVSDIFHKR